MYLTIQHILLYVLFFLVSPTSREYEWKSLEPSLLNVEVKTSDVASTLVEMFINTAYLYSPSYLMRYLPHG